MKIPGSALNVRNFYCDILFCKILFALQYSTPYTVKHATVYIECSFKTSKSVRNSFTYIVFPMLLLKCVPMYEARLHRCSNWCSNLCCNGVVKRTFDNHLYNMVNHSWCNNLTHLERSIRIHLSWLVSYSRTSGGSHKQ